MSFSSDNPPPVRFQFTVPLKCHCGQNGSMVWEENKDINPEGTQPVLISISGRFYERVSKRDRASIEVVCQRCEAVQMV
jgi:hypothetical protein